MNELRDSIPRTKVFTKIHPNAGFHLIWVTEGD